MKEERFDPLNDLLFFKTMGEKGDEVQLLSFLNAVLGHNGEPLLATVEIAGNRSVPPELPDDKAGVLDVLAKTGDGTKINIEVQLENEHNMEKRSLFYWGKKYLDDFKAGQDYRELPPVITINIIDFRYLETKGYHSCFHLREDTERDILLTEALEIHFIEMVKFRSLLRKAAGNGFLADPLNQWLTYLNKDSPKHLLEEVLTMNEGIRQIQQKTDDVLQDEAARHAILRHEMWLSDMTSMRNYAHDKGYARGLKTGVKKGVADVARKMKANGLPPEQISACTGLTEAQIQAL